MSEIAVPVKPAYRGRHRKVGEDTGEARPHAAEMFVACPVGARAVGEATVEVRPRTLAEDNGPTRKLNVASSFRTAARAVFGLGIR